jgi:hypothetical protein
MSDPAWLADQPYDLADGILFVQAAGTGTEPTSADEVGHVTNYEDSHEAQVKESKYLHVSDTQVAVTGYAHSGSFTLVIARGANAVRTRIRNAIKNKTLLKITLQLGDEETGEIEVYDRCVISTTKSGEEDGWTFEVSFQAGSWSGTEASDPA